MPNPCVYVDGPQPCYLSSGGKLDQAMGYHAFFVTYVPFIPSFLSDDFTRMIAYEASRIKLIVNRQVRFLNDLSSCGTGAAQTFDLRFVSIPQPDQPYNKIHIFFLGKAFGKDKSQAEANAIDLWHRFRSFFPLEDPFNYPLRTIMVEEDDSGKSRVSDPELLRLALQPIDFAKGGEGRLVEVRKYEDRDPILSSESPDEDQLIGYYPHPFRPTLDYSAMSRFLETFAIQDQRCVASICLRPTSLSLEEQKSINMATQQYARLLDGATEASNWLKRYRQERYDDLVATFEPLINKRRHLFSVKIQVLGEHYAPLDVVAALGSEVMNNSTPEPRLWSEVAPEEPAEIDAAFRNFAMMEYRPWRLPDPSSPLWRLSTLVTSYEAVGVFRLPVPPESGHMPGISVHDDPFVLPASLSTPEKSKVKDRHVALGNIIHRGIETKTDFYVSLTQLKRHALVAGSTGSGKTNTCLHLLTELWRGEPQIPFLVIYPIDKPDYRLLQADESVRDKLLVFTVGDDTVSPFRFNPFHVPPGILVRTHMSLLMRAFSAAFTMWDPLPAVYRAALRRTYEDAGFRDLTTAKGGDPGTRALLLGRFYEILVETSEEMTRAYGREAKGNIRQGAEIRMRDLLQNAGHVLNVQEGAPWDQILEHPTVMEIGRVGSSSDTALVMGFLLMSLTSFLSYRQRRDAHPKQHITLIEEAHRLMSAGSGGTSEGLADPRGTASEDFAHMLAEVRGFGEGLIIAEQTPTELVSGAIGNTYLKLMHWLEEQSSFDLFCDIMSLNRQQRDYARTMPVGQAILRDTSGRPVLVKVKNYLDQFQHADDTPIIDDSDAAIKRFMGKQIPRHQIGIAKPVPFVAPGGKASPGDDKDQKWRIPAEKLSWLTRWPMKSCAFCRVLHETGGCRHREKVLRHFIEASGPREITYREDLLAALGQDESALMWEGIGRLGHQIEGRLRNASPGDRRGVVYCFLAHQIDRIEGAPEASRAEVERGQQVLAGFEENYKRGEANLDG